jgi:hypothetical protein
MIQESLLPGMRNLRPMQISLHRWIWMIKGIKKGSPLQPKPLLTLNLILCNFDAKVITFLRLPNILKKVCIIKENTLSLQLE